MISPLDYCLYWSGCILTRAASAGLDARQSSQKTQISPKIRIGAWRRIVSLSPGETLKRILGWHDFSRFIGLADSGGNGLWRIFAMPKMPRHYYPASDPTRLLYSGREISFLMPGIISSPACPCRQ